MEASKEGGVKKVCSHVRAGKIRRDVPSGKPARAGKHISVKN